MKPDLPAVQHPQDAGAPRVLRSLAPAMLVNAALALCAGACSPGDPSAEDREQVNTSAGALCAETYPDACGNGLWPSQPGGALGVIPYTISAALPAAQQENVLAGMNEWNNSLAGAVVFRPKQVSDARWVHFSETPSTPILDCGGSLRNEVPAVNFPALECGRLSGNVQNNNIVVTGNLLHELGHLIAFEHHHQRSDRDRYVILKDVALLVDGGCFETPQLDSDMNYTKCAPNSPYPTAGTGPGGTFGVYDFKSVMHYSSVPPGQAVTNCALPLPGGGGGDTQRGLIRRGVAVPPAPNPSCPADVPYSADTERITVHDRAAAIEAYATKTDWAPFVSMGRDVGPTTPLDFSLASGVFATGSPAIASLGGIASGVVTRGSDDNIWYATVINESVTTWSNLGRPASSSLAGDPAIVSWSQSTARIDVVVVATVGGIRKVWKKAYHDGAWETAWDQSMGSPPGTLVGGIALASWGVNRLDVFANGTDGRLWHQSWNPGWGAWDNPGGVHPSGSIGTPAAVSWGPGRIDMVVFAGAGNIWHFWWDGSWAPSWTSIHSGFFVGAPALASQGPGRMELFVRTSIQQLGRMHCSSAPCKSAADWSSVQVLGGYLMSSPAASSPRNLARTDVVATSDDGSALPNPNSNVGLWHKWWPWGISRRVRGDFSGDGQSDIALTGGPGWDAVPVAFSNGSEGTFDAVSNGLANFPDWAQAVGAQPVSGDFNGDGRDDVALTGGMFWTTVPVAFSKGNGTFNVTNSFVANFPAWAQVAGVKPVSGDFDGDGRDDIALTGGSGWDAIPVAFSNGDGTFNAISNGPLANFPAWASTAGAKPVSGDFNADGRGDVALTGGPWGFVAVALSNGNGTFSVTNAPLANFPGWAQVFGAKPVAGDFNGDRRGDIALTGGQGWDAVPVAFSNGDGTFNVPSFPSLPNFPGWAQVSGAKPVGGDFNGDGRGDIALVGGQGWDAVRVALSNGSGAFTELAAPLANFPGWAQVGGAKPVSGG